MATIIKPPTVIHGGHILFLAGSIEMGKAERWQERVEEALSGVSDLLILNPRRDDWDASWKQSIDNAQFREQVEWELAGMDRADVIAMYFAPGTKSPITLLELGLQARSDKLVVFCPDGFWRKGNVDVVCRRHGVHQVYDFSSLITAIQARLGTD